MPVQLIKKNVGDLEFPNGSYIDESPCLSLVSHWYPFSRSCSSNNNFDIGNLFAISSLRAHYVKLPKPGEAFSSLTHMDEEFRQLLRARRGGQECRQS